MKKISICKEMITLTITKSIKKESKEFLKNNWTNAIAVCVIAIFFNLLLTTLEGFLIAISEYFALGEKLSHIIHVIASNVIIEMIIAVSCGFVWLFLISPLLIGKKRWYGNLSLKNPLPIKEIFHFFTSPKRYFKSVVISLFVFLQLTFYFIVLSIIPISSFALSNILMSNMSQTTQSFGIIAFLLGCGFLLIAVIIMVKLCLDFSLATYVFAMNEDIKILKAIKLSKLSVNKKESILILFNLSFVHLFILSALIIPLFFILPYYNCAHIVIMNKLLENHQKHSPNIT